MTPDSQPLLRHSALRRRIEAIKARIAARAICKTCRGLGTVCGAGYYLDADTCDRCGGKGWT